MSFISRHHLEKAPGAPDFHFVLQGDRLLVRAGEYQEIHLPTWADLAGWTTESPFALGLLEEHPCWASAISDDKAAAPAGWEWRDLRTLLAALPASRIQAVSTARQLAWWHSRTHFCGVCGTALVDADNERARKCPRCNSLFYPSAFPAVIVAVLREDRILLAHNRRFAPGLFSLIAGFVDPGETLEQAAAREVREETGLEITGITYLTSQPWPFPNSLMLAFRARHAAGEIAVDGDEIESAGWYARDHLPTLPRPGTVARRVIDAWLAGPLP